MTFSKTQRKVLPGVLLSFVLITVLSATPLMACPQETVRYPTFTLPHLEGRLLPYEGEELLPGTRVDFVIHNKSGESSERWDVPVGADGTFVIGLPEGTYGFKIQVEGFLFTLVGEVIITRESPKDATMVVRPPWC